MHLPLVPRTLLPRHHLAALLVLMSGVCSAAPAQSDPKSQTPGVARPSDAATSVPLGACCKAAKPGPLLPSGPGAGITVGPDGAALAAGHAEDVYYSGQAPSARSAPKAYRFWPIRKPLHIDFKRRHAGLTTVRFHAYHSHGRTLTPASEVRMAKLLHALLGAAMRLSRLGQGGHQVVWKACAVRAAPTERRISAAARCFVAKVRKLQQGHDAATRTALATEAATGLRRDLALFRVADEVTARGYLLNAKGQPLPMRVNGRLTAPTTPPAGPPGAREDVVTYRWALPGLVLGIAFLVYFSRLGQMSWGMIGLFWLLYLTVIFVVTRMRAELGPPVHDFHRMGPDLMITKSFGSANLGGNDLTMLALYWWFNRAYRSHPMPHQIEGLKAAQQVRHPLALYVIGMLLAGVIGSGAAIWAYLHLGYRLGAAAKFWSGYGYGWENFGMLQTWLEVPTEATAGASYAVLAGFLFSLFLLVMRLRFLGWPFHPIGFAISSSWAINLVWTCLFASWLVKLIMIRYGGLKLYRQARPFFLGLILGDCLMGSAWAVVGIVLEIPTYSFWGA